MSNTWWVGQSELDSDQQNIIALPIDESALIIGPPGSGKTNLLLLRANYLSLAGHPNIAIVTFTRSLCEFISSGANQYDFHASKIMTCREWQLDLLRQYGYQITLEEDFEKSRDTLANAMMEMIEKQGLSKIYDAILLDEAQDYSSVEIRIFARLAERLFCVADDRQKIYKGAPSIGEIIKVTGDPKVLRYHYRNGIKICQVADEIAKGWPYHSSLRATSQYDEKSNPSSVDSWKCDTLAEQAELIISRLGTQIAAFPNELIGVLCPTKGSMNTIWEAILASPFSAMAYLMHGPGVNSFPQDKPIIVTTFHAAKGLEFRALHLAGCDELKSFGNNRQLTFMAVTRAKTALSIYHCGGLHGYFESAIRSLDPMHTPPPLDSIFGVKR